MRASQLPLRQQCMSNPRPGNPIRLCCMFCGCRGFFKSAFSRGTLFVLGIPLILGTVCSSLCVANPIRPSKSLPGPPGAPSGKLPSCLPRNPLEGCVWRPVWALSARSAVSHGYELQSLALWTSDFAGDSCPPTTFQVAPKKEDQSHMTITLESTPGLFFTQKRTKLGPASISADSLGDLEIEIGRRTAPSES